MITTEQFECLIPSPNAINEDVIFCVGTAPDNYLVLGDIATWATAFFTLLLFVGAVLAWRKSRDTLNHMRKDSVVAADRFQAEMLQRENQAHQVRVDTATHALISAIADLIKASRGTDQDVLRISAEVRKATVQYNLVWEFNARERQRVDRFVTSLVLLARSATHEDLRLEGALSVLDSGYSEFCDWVSELARGEIEMDEYTLRLVNRGNEFRTNHDRWFKIMDARFRGEEISEENDWPEGD